MCWFQGYEKLKGLQKECCDRWRKMNKSLDFHFLTERNIKDYTPEYYDIINNSIKTRSPQANSDLLRLLLLSKFGGTWVDATVYPTLPLNGFYYDIVNETGFFAYRQMPRKWGADISSWFLIADEPKNNLIEKWKEKFVEKFLFSEDWPYFTLHHTLAELYDNNEEIRGIIENMVQVNQSFAHSALGEWEQRHLSYVYKKPKNPSCQE